MHKNEPSKETRPHATQIIKHKPTDSVARKTRLGEINIPDPIKRMFIILRTIITKAVFTDNTANYKANT